MNKLKFAVSVIINKRSFESFMCLDNSKSLMLCLKDHESDSSKILPLCLKDKGTAVRVWQLCLKYKMCSFLGRIKSVFSGNEEIKLKSDLLVIRWSRDGEERES